VPVDLERAESLFGKLDDLLSKTRAKPLPERVHHIRTTTRRVEALLETLLGKSDAPRKLMKRLGRLRKRAGKVRDMDVQMAALRTVKIGREPERKVHLMQYLSDRRLKFQDRLVEELDADASRKLRKQLAKVKNGLFPAPAISAPVAEEQASPARKPKYADAATLSAKLDPVGLALRRFAAVARAFSELDENNLHEFRTECKRVRYTTEMAVADEEARHVLDLLKEMQDQVGDWHDWQVLTAEAAQLFADPGPESALIAALRNMTQAKFTASRNHCLGNRRELLKLYRERNRRLRQDALAAAAERKKSQPAEAQAESPTLVAAGGSGAA